MNFVQELEDGTGGEEKSSVASRRDNFAQITKMEVAKQLSGAELFLRLKEEYETLEPQIIVFLSRLDRHAAPLSTAARVFYDRVFKGFSTTELVHVYQISKAMSYHWIREFVKVIDSLVALRQISISDEMNEFLHRGWGRQGGGLRKWSELFKSYEDYCNGKLATPGQLRETMRKRAYAVLKRKGGELAPEKIEQILAKAAEAELRNEDVTALRQYILTAVQNGLTDQVRSKVAEDKRQLRLEAKEKQKQEREAAIRMKEEARQEMQGLMTEEVFSRSKKGKMPLMVELLYLTIFEEMNDADCAKRFPGTSRDTRDQWRRRARLFIWPMISGNLRKTLSKHTKTIDK